jgi:hypothetical protein
MAAARRIGVKNCCICIFFIARAASEVPLPPLNEQKHQTLCCGGVLHIFYYKQLGCRYARTKAAAKALASTTSTCSGC